MKPNILFQNMSQNSSRVHMPPTNSFYFRLKTGKNGPACFKLHDPDQIYAVSYDLALRAIWSDRYRISSRSCWRGFTTRMGCGTDGKLTLWNQCKTHVLGLSLYKTLDLITNDAGFHSMQYHSFIFIYIFLVISSNSSSTLDNRHYQNCHYS